MLVLHGIAMICGFVPLVAGSVVFLLYLLIRDQALTGIGLVVIFIGLCCAFIGLVCAGIFYYQAKSADPAEATIAKRRAKLDIAIILANFPIAFVMAGIGIWLMSRVTIVIHNEGNTSIDSLVLTTQDGKYTFANIKPGASAIKATMHGDMRAVSCDITRGKQTKTYSLPGERFAGGIQDNTFDMYIHNDSAEVGYWSD